MTLVDHQPQSWTCSIHEFIARNNITCSSATSMQGGHSTYIWKLEDVRVTPAIDSEATITSAKCVLKFAEETAKMKNLALPRQRLQWEHRALHSHVVQQACMLEPSIRVPRTLYATEQALILDWAGDIDLRTAILTGTTQEERGISSHLGKWLAHMHKAGLRDDDDDVKSWSNNGMAEKVLSLEEAGIRTVLAAHGVQSSTIDRAITTFRQPAGGLETGVIFDFRPMNVLLSDLEGLKPGISVIDLECATYADPACDLHLWLAEALIIEAQSHRQNLVSPFLTAYALEAGSEIASKAFVCKVAVMLGAVWSFSSLSVWDAHNDVEMWRRLAAEFIRAGAEGDMEWLASSVLKPLLIHH